MQSSLGRNPFSVHTPFERAATITARCEMLLSPGTVISRSIREARFTRSSIQSTERPDVHPECSDKSLCWSGIQYRIRGTRECACVMAQEKCCPCKDPSLQCREGI